MWQAINQRLRIRNPLVGIPQGALFEDVEAFATEHNLTDILPLLKKGALVAQDLLDLDRVEGLTETERTELQLEQTNRWVSLCLTLKVVANHY